MICSYDLLRTFKGHPASDIHMQERRFIVVMKAPPLPHAGINGYVHVRVMNGSLGLRSLSISGSLTTISQS
jgi:hypothetical protein